MDKGTLRVKADRRSLVPGEGGRQSISRDRVCLPRQTGPSSGISKWAPIQENLKIRFTGVRRIVRNKKYFLKTYGQAVAGI